MFRPLCPLLFAACSSVGQPGTFELDVQHDGVSRTSVVFVPTTFERENPAPVLLNFHGFGGSSRDHLQAADLRELAEEDGVILAYPQGTLLDGSSHWNAAGPGADNKSQADDLGFVETLLDTIDATYPVDREQLYAAGYSNGGMFSFFLACERPGGLAGVVSVSGAMLQESCQPARAPSVLTLHGTADGVIPYEGGEVMSAGEVIRTWVTINGAAPQAETRTTTLEGQTVESVHHAAGSAGAPVRHHRFIGGEHIWFASANELIWDALPLP